jgi:hypothetical protein
MAPFVGLRRWARLGFYVALGAASAIVAACGGSEESGPASPGDAGATGGAAGTGGSAGAGGGTSGAAGSTSSAGGSTSGTGGSAGASGSPADGGKLWDVICE